MPRLIKVIEADRAAYLNPAAILIVREHGTTGSESIAVSTTGAAILVSMPAPDLARLINDAELPTSPPSKGGGALHHS